MDGQALADRGGPAPAYVSVFEARMLQLRAESLELDVQNARLTSCKATRDQRNVSRHGLWPRVVSQAPWCLRSAATQCVHLRIVGAMGARQGAGQTSRRD